MASLISTHVLRKIRREVMRKNAEARVKTWKVQKLEATVAQEQEVFQSKLAEQQRQIEALIAGLQKVSAQLEMSEPAPHGA